LILQAPDEPAIVNGHASAGSWLVELESDVDGARCAAGQRTDAMPGPSEQTSSIACVYAVQVRLTVPAKLLTEAVVNRAECFPVRGAGDKYKARGATASS